MQETDGLLEWLFGWPMGLIGWPLAVILFCVAAMLVVSIVDPILRPDDSVPVDENECSGCVDPVRIHPPEAD